MQIYTILHIMMRVIFRTCKPLLVNEYMSAISTIRLGRNCLGISWLLS